MAELDQTIRSAFEREVSILVLDMYEHSYHMDFGAAAGQYIDAFMRNINWEVAAQRLDEARRQSH